MKKRVLSMALALVLTLGLAAPVFAEAEDAAPAKRLVRVDRYGGEELSVSYNLGYTEGALLPALIVEGNELLAYDMEYLITSVQSYGVPYEYWDMGLLGVYLYDETGRLTDSTINTERSVITKKLTYDENGNLTLSSTEWRENEEDQAVYYEYYYENGILCDVFKTIRSGGTEMMTDCLYNYDEQTGLLSTSNEMNSEVGDSIPGELKAGESVTRNFEYDGEGRLTSTVVTNRLVAGTDRKSATGYTYEDHDGGTITYQYAPGLVIASYATEQPCCEVYLGDSADFVLDPALGVKLLAFDTAGEVTLTCDDEGYLTRLDAGDGVYYEFTYEPVA